MQKRKFVLLVILMFTILFSISSISYASYEEPNYLVKYGSTGEGVKWVQDILKQNGYTVLIDGVFGSKTQNAVIHFQKCNNLVSDGIVRRKNETST